MRKITHEIFAAGMALLLINPDITYILPTILASVLGGVFPDIDVKFKHRKLMHNVFSLTIIGLSPLYVTMFIITRPIPILTLLLQAFFIGYFTHMLLDLFTKRGIALMWPLTSKTFKIINRRYDDFFINTLFSSLGLGALALYIIRITYSIV